MKFAYGLALLLLIGAGLYVFTSRPNPPSIDEPFSTRVSYWQKRIDRLGGERAYNEFAESVRDLPIHQQHAAVHAFGGALFAAQGVSGLSICDSRFSYGCFHEFLGQAVKSYGQEIISELNDACATQLSSSPLSCQHGIGHGTLSSFGYEREGLLNALKECQGLKNGDPVGGCYGGVFMEYNVRTMLADTVTPRDYAGDPFDPCNSLNDEFKIACIYWQPQWWIATVLYSETRHARYERMGEYCRAFGKNAQLHRACFEGIGNIVEEQSKENPIFARELCDKAGKTSKERLFCRSIGANHFGLDMHFESGVAVCGGLDGQAYEYCTAYARNEANIVHIRDIPEL